MPLVTIWRKPEMLNGEAAINLRDSVLGIVATHLKVQSFHVEIHIRNVGELDMNCAPVGIIVETGPGKNNWRKEQCDRIGDEMASTLRMILQASCRGSVTIPSYIWLRAGGASRFVPIEWPENAR